MGQVVFTGTTTMTADGPFQYILHQLSGNKWVNGDVETETSAGIVPFTYHRRSYVHATQWSIGLELALLIDDPWKIFLTTDHPNAAPFTTYPRIVSWLVSKTARERTMRKINKRARSKSLLPSTNREYSLYEIAIVTRAGQAKALGLKNKGHLGAGADADVSIYNFNPEKTDPSKKFITLRKAFENAAYTIKDGQIVVKDGEVAKPVTGRTFWVKPEVSTFLMKSVNELKGRFQEYYTVQFENYPIPESHLAFPSSVQVKAEV